MAKKKTHKLIPVYLKLPEKRVVFKIFVVSIILVPIIGWLFTLTFNGNKTSKIASTYNLSPIPTPLPIPTSHRIKISNDVTFPHEYLPSFDINIPTSWNVVIKQFGEADDIGFTNRSANGAPIEDVQRTMGVRLSSGEVQFDLIYGIASDNNAYICSTSAEGVSIGNGWYRIVDERGYFYTKNMEIKNSGQICYRGTGNFLQESTPKEIDPEGFGNLFMAHPKIVTGIPGPQLLTEIDNMVRSIKGLR